MNILKLKLGAKLGLGIGLILLMMMILSIFVITKLTGMNQDAARIEADLSSKTLVSSINTTVKDNAISSMEMLLNTDSNLNAKIVKQIEDRNNSNAALLQTLNRDLAGSEENEKLLAEMKKHRGLYISGLDKVMALVKSGKREEATYVAGEEMIPMLAPFLRVVNNLDTYQQTKVDASTMQIKETAKSIRNMTIILGVIALALGVIIGIMIVRNLMKQLGGEPDYAAASVHKIAGGDLTSNLNVKAGDTSSMMYSLQVMQDSLRKIVAGIKESVDLIDTSSKEIAQGNTDLSQRTEEQAASLEETAASMEQLTSTVKQNAENAKQANQLARGASEIASKGGAVVGQVVGTMSSINESSRKIVDIISVIDGIAFQTNILALNAAVEAARAGEQGRGFAVVAAEVRNLAQRSAAAAKEIKTLIGSSVEKVEDGTRLVDEAGKTMEGIVTAVKRVTDIMAEISAASNEQSTGIEQVNQAITQMDEVTQQNAALVEEAAAAAESMEEEAQHLSQSVSVFKLDGMASAQPQAQRAMASAQPQAERVSAQRPSGSARKPAAMQAPAVPAKKLAAKPKAISKHNGGGEEWAEF